MVGALLSTLSALSISLSLFLPELFSFGLRSPAPPPLFLSLDPSHFPLLVLSSRSKRPIFVRRHEKKVYEQWWSERARELRTQRVERGRESQRDTRSEKRKEKEISACVRTWEARARARNYAWIHAHILILASIWRSCATHMYRTGSKLRNFVQIAREGSHPWLNRLYPREKSAKAGQNLQEIGLLVTGTSIKGIRSVRLHAEARGNARNVILINSLIRGTRNRDNSVFVFCFPFDRTAIARVCVLPNTNIERASRSLSFLINLRITHSPRLLIGNAVRPFPATFSRIWRAAEAILIGGFYPDTMRSTRFTMQFHYVSWRLLRRISNWHKIHAILK